MVTTDYFVNVEDENLLLEIQNRVFAKENMRELVAERKRLGLTQYQIEELFLSSRTNVAEHIKHISEEGELDENSTCRNSRQVQMKGNREVTRNILNYNLDVISTVGYRVNFNRVIAFRIWQQMC